MSLKDVFVNKAIATKGNVPYKEECPIDYVGTVTVNSNMKLSVDFWFEDTLRDKHKNELGRIPSSNDDIITIVLESPHKNEYKDASFIHPALYTTGRNLQSKFKDVVSHFKNDLVGGKTYHVYLINAIPFQCSLNEKTSMYRTEVFKNVWDNGGEASFKRTLKGYHPSIIYNLCTVGKKTAICKSLRKLVDNAIHSSGMNSSPKVHSGDHPSSWSNKNTRCRCFSVDCQAFERI